MKKSLLFLSALLVCGAAYAQVSGVGIPAVFITSPTGAEQINVLGSGAQIETITLSQARDASGYLAISQTSSDTRTIPNNVSVLAYYGVTSGTATLTMAAAPVDGQRFQVFSTAGVGTLTLTANTGQTVNNGATSLAANGNVEYIYQLSNKTWYRIQ